MAKTHRSKGKSAAKAKSKAQPKANLDATQKEATLSSTAATKGEKGDKIDKNDKSDKIGKSDKGEKSTQKKAASSKKTQPSKKATTPKKVQKKPSVFRRILTYFANVRLEIKRTTWPTRNEVYNMTIIVIIALLFFGVLIFLIDQIMVVLVEFISQFRLGSNAEPTLEATNLLPLITDSFVTGGK